MLVSKAERSTSTNKGGMRVMNATARHVMNGTEILANQRSPRQEARASLFITGDQMSYYNALKTPNHLPHQ
jgi:hypothetical protein